MTDLPPFKRQRGVARPQPADAVAVTTASSFRWTQGRPPPRDTAFLGIHARGLADLAATLATGGIGPATAVDTAKAHLDPYGTLAEKHARVHPLAAAEAVMLAGKRMSSLVGCLSTTTAARDKAKEAGINPPLWSLGHVAYFYEANVLGVLELPCPALNRLSPTLFGGQSRSDLFDSIRVNRTERIASPLWSDPATTDVLAYTAAVRDDLLAGLRQRPGGVADGLHPVDTYIVAYAVVHEHWHIEDMLCTLQLLGLPSPPLGLFVETDVAVQLTDPDGANSAAPAGAPSAASAGDPPGELPWVAVPAGDYCLGGRPTDPWVFDQEKWAHRVSLPAFQIRRTPVTNAEFAAFVAAGGYTEELQAMWSQEGWRWRVDNAVTRPQYWSPAETGGGWMVARFDTLVPLPDCHPASHVSFWEAEAYCAWAGVRLPTEAEWEVAATLSSDSHDPGDADPERRTKTRYPWGSDLAGGRAANIGGRLFGTIGVEEHRTGDSATGCRQMCGNVWEWTATTFYPYPGYVMDFPYRENSAPWFGFSKVVKGGAWCTSLLLAYTRHRNFYDPGERREVPTGFRSVRL